MLAFSALVQTGASAATSDTTFLVSATVLDVCAVVASPLAFGNYTPSSPTPNDITSTITVTCTAGLDYTIALDQGTTMGADITHRLMVDADDNTLGYGIYTDNTYGTVWGDGTSTTSTVGPITGNGTAQGRTVYGRITAGQYVPSGAYTDTVTVTVTY